MWQRFPAITPRSASPALLHAACLPGSPSDGTRGSNYSTSYRWGFKAPGTFQRQQRDTWAPGNGPAPIESTPHTDSIVQLGSFWAPLLSFWLYAPTAPVAHHTSKKKTKNNLSCYWLSISHLLILLTDSLLAKGEGLWSTFSGARSFVMLSFSCHLLQRKQSCLLSLP